MKRALRLLRMVRGLPRGHGRPASTASSLAEQYDTSERSIYRDIGLLQEAGYPIVNDREGYYLLPTDRAVPVDLTSGEIASLLYASHWVEESVPASLRPDFRAVIGKLTNACGTDDAVVAALDSDDGIDISAPQTDGPRAVGNMAVAIMGRRKCRKLQGTYHTPDRDAETDRVLHPYAITFRGDAHYLVAYCEFRDEVRTFRLDRFERLEILDERADIPDRYDLDEHFSGAWEVTGGRRQCVRIRVSGKTARRLKKSRHHHSQEIVSRDGDELVLQFHVAITDEFRSWLLSLGPDAVVLSPSTLRQKMAEITEELSANYSST